MNIHDALALHQAGKIAQAERAYREILSRDPQNPDAMHLLGVIALDGGKIDEAQALISNAIRLDPGAAIFHNNLGNVYLARKDLGQGEQCYRRAISIKQDYVDAWINLGTTLRQMARFEESVNAYANALRIDPNSARALEAAGTVLKDQGRIDEALATYSRAFALDPSLKDAHGNYIYALHCSEKVSPQRLFDEHVRWAAAHSAKFAMQIQPHANDRSPTRRLRIGYVSGDFREHPVSRFLWPLIEHRDRESFEVHCFSNNDINDAVTDHYRSAVDAWHEIRRLNDDEAANMIRNSAIDILIDLSGHTGDARWGVFARKPAPVQFTYLGYPDTTGMSQIDYRLTDALADPPGTEESSVETLARVPGCFLCYPLASDLPKVTELPAKSNGFITFGSFNNLSKISPTTIAMWSAVLRAVPTARMIIKTTTFGDRGTLERAAKRFSEQGLPMNRVQLLGPTRKENEHVAQYRLIDIALDTFPYTGTTTTCEALAMGVPVVSRFGAHHASRVGLSVLSAAGHPEWATDDPIRFIQIANELASDPCGLAKLRAEMRDRLKTSILCDTKAFAQQIEAIYRQAWTKWTIEGT